MTLTHNGNVGWADSATDKPDVGGLSDFGREVVAEMQRLGMLVDLSHVAPADHGATRWTPPRAPVIFSHSSARALCDHPRNVPDEILAGCPATTACAWSPSCPPSSPRSAGTGTGGGGGDAAARHGPRGLPGVRRGPPGVAAASPPPKATLAQVADHVEHVREVAGVEHVGIGSDFDGTTDLPEGLADVSCFPALFAELLDRGWSEDDCARLAGGNVLRVMRAAEALRRRRAPPAEALAEVRPGPLL